MSKMLLPTCWLLFLISFTVDGLTVPSPRQVLKSVDYGFKQRLAADPSFTTKSIIEVFLAASTQMSAEWNRRGAGQILPQIDFVVAGVLTAMAGKYYSMWRVAPTLSAKRRDDKDATMWGTPVPTNAFQATLLDGKTIPKISQRLMSIIAPIQSLFQAGLLASALGYGCVAALIGLRTWLLPSFEASTQNVNILYASLYTGAFMAIVSNLRYQVMQGIVEPKIVGRFKKYPMLHTTLTFVVRLGNGFLGSLLAIMGMRKLGLQKLK